MKRLTKKIKECGRTIPYVSSGDCKDIWNTPRWFVGNAIDRLSELEDILGDDYDLIRLREIVEADREGRCVVLPCQPSDITVYQLRDKKHVISLETKNMLLGEVFMLAMCIVRKFGQMDIIPCSTKEISLVQTENLAKRGFCLKKKQRKH